MIRTVIIVIIIITRCYVKANSFVQFLCPEFALTYVEFALTSSRYSYGINPIVGIRLLLVIIMLIIILIIVMIMIIIIHVIIIVIIITMIIINDNDYNNDAHLSSCNLPCLFH